MRAIAVNEWGGRDALELLDVEPPPVAPDGVLVRVRAAALNPVDYKVREGKLAGGVPVPLPGDPRLGRGGRGRAGRARGHLVQARAIRSTATAAGTTSSTAPTPSSPRCPEGYLAHMPEELSFEEAAALPLAALTAHQSLERLGLRGGENLFLTGGAGGVGHIAIQLALARGARVIASGSPASFDFIRELGAEPVDYHDPDHPARVRELTARRRRRRRVRPLRRRRPGAGLRRAAPGRPAGLDRLAAEAARALRDRLRLRPPLRLRPRRAHHAARQRRAACAPTSPRPSRSRTPPPPTSASRPATCAASSSSPSPKGDSPL